MTDHPHAARHGWRLLRTEYPFTFPIFQVRRDWLCWPDGEERPYAYLEVAPGVMVVPVTPEGEIVLMRQFRYPADAWLWELPAGGSYNFAGDDLADLARQELAEEVGGYAASMEYVGAFRMAVALLDLEMHLYLAQDVRLGEAHREPGEQIEVHRVPIETALALARSGEIVAVSTAYALLRCEAQLREMMTH